MKPIIILPPEAISPEDIKLLRDNGLCVVVSQDPSKVKFVDPIPASSSRTEIEQAAIRLSRILLNGQWGHYSAENTIGKNTISKIYVDLLIEGTPLDKNPTIQEREQEYFNTEKKEEIKRLAREEVRAERAAAKSKPAK